MAGSDVPLWQWSACDLADATAAGELTCETVVRTTVERMRSVNAHLNAVVDDLGDDAIEKAVSLDRSQRISGPAGPLHGVPVTVKCNIDQRGRATSNGVAAFAGVIAQHDSPIVRNLQNAGAIIIGRTNTPEFSLRATTSNPLFGRTLNPWQQQASPGGSSGGAAAAVMGGMGPIAHGNDLAGSLRYPAAACGAATVKPGLGRLPSFNPSSSSERGPLTQIMSVQGVIAREVRDVRLAMEALIAYDARDPWMVPMPFEGVPLRAPVRVAMTCNMHGLELHPAIERAMHAAADALRDAGYRLEMAEPPLVAEAAADSLSCLFGELRVFMRDDIRRHGSDEINRIVDDYHRAFAPFEGDELLRGMARRAHYVREWMRFLAVYPLVLTPFLPSPTLPWNHDAGGLAGVRDLLGAALYGHTMNFLGLPAGNVPAGAPAADGSDLPVGVQIIGRRFREDTILDACEAIESRIGLMAPRLFARG